MGTHLPNLITLCRLLAVPLAVYLILVGALAPAFWLFVAAGISDALDGFLARMLNARTQLGAYLDPLADKLLLVCVYLALAGSGRLPLWLVILVVSRDVMIIGGVLLLFTMREKLTVQPLEISKLNTFLQIILAGWVLAVGGLGVPDPKLGPVMTVSQLLVLLVAATTILSGAAYLVGQAARFAGRGGGTESE